MRSYTTAGNPSFFNQRQLARNFVLLAFTCVISWSALAQEPTNHVTGFTKGTVTSTSIQLNWTGSTGGTTPSNYLIIARKSGGNFQTVIDGVAIADDNDFTDVNSNGARNTTHVVGANTYTFTGLDAGIQYDFLIYPYNTNPTINYKTDGSVPSLSVFTIAAEPTAASTAMTFSNITATSITVGKTSGAGTGAFRMLVAREGSAVNFTPIDGVSYTAEFNTNYTTAIEVGNATEGNKIVGLGNDASFVVNGLSGDKTYHFRIYEFNGTAGTGAENYLTSASLTGNRNTEPTTNASNLAIGSVTTTGLTLSWTIGDGDRRIVLAREGAAVDADPVDFTNYTASANWSSKGTEVGTGNYVVFAGTGTSVNMTNLAPGTRYYFTVFEANGAGVTTSAYLTPGASIDRYTLAAEPTATSTAMTFSNITATSITVGKTSGAGTGAFRMLVAREASAVNFTPTDGVSYTTEFNPNYSTAIEVGTATQGNKIVGLGNDATFVVTGLDGDKIYHFRIYEFNGTAGTGSENYRTSSSLNSSRNTEPTTQASFNATTSITVSGMTLNWTNGNGDRRIVLMRAGSAVNADPNDLTSYAEESNWGLKGGANNEIGSGNFVVYEGGSTTSVAVTNLQANTTYHFAIYEYNSYVGGSVQTSTTSAAFLTPAGVASATTLTDSTDPANFTVGTVTSSGGTVRSGYWNASNTNLNVVVPLVNSDPTLDLGTVKLQMKRTLPLPASSFTDIPGALDAGGSGWSTITYAQRTSGTKTISVSRANLELHPDFIEGATFQITAIISDYSGNTRTGTQSAQNMVIDQTPPTAGIMTLTNNGAGNSEVVTWLFSEQIDINGDGAYTVGGDQDKAMVGFSVTNGGASTIGSATYEYDPPSSPTPVLLQGRLVSSGNTGWTTSTTVNYTQGGGSNIRDAAGNEMTSFTGAAIADVVAPYLITGIVFNPNTSAPGDEIITFRLSEPLLNAEGNVLGFKVSQPLANTSAIATYSGKNSTETITLNSNGATWTDDITVSYDQGDGNVTDAVPLEMLAFTEPILLKSVNIKSNNAAPNTYAKPGDIITLTFTASRTLVANPVVTIGTPAQTATFVSLVGSVYTYTYNTTPNVINNGNVAFSITADETGPPEKQTIVTVTTDGSSIIYDNTAPVTPPNLDFGANDPFNQDTGISQSDNYTSTQTNLYFSGTGVEANSIITLYEGANPIGPTAIASGLGNWNITVPSLSDGIYSITVTSRDAAGNVSSASAPLVLTIDNTPPTVTSIAVNSLIFNHAPGINGTTPSYNNPINEIDFMITFDEPVSGVSNNSISRIISGSITNNNIPTITPWTQPTGGTSTVAPSRYWKVVYSNVSGAGLFSINLINDPSIFNNVGISLNGGNLVGQSYTVCLPQPPSPVGSITTTAIGDNSITVNWTNVTGATHYLAILTTSATAPVADGSYVNNDNVFGDGTMALNITPGSGSSSATFTGITSNTAYNIFVYPYALSPFTTTVNNTAIDFNPTPSRLSRSANIIRDLSFTYPQNIDYKLYLASGIDLERFSVSDGGGAPFADGLPTILTGLTLNNISNWQNLNTLALYDGATPVGVPVSVTGSAVTFSGLSFNVAEGTTKTLTVKGTFKTAVTDNHVISFNLSAISASQTGSTQFINTAPAIASNPTVDQNKIEVTATQLHITTPATATTVSLNSPFTVVVQARDVNLNVDLDFEGASKDITALTNASGATMVSTPVVVGQQFTDGVYNFPLDFKFTSGNNNDNVTLSITAGGISTVAPPAPFTPTLTLQASSESAIVKDPTFNFTTNIPYEAFPEATDLTNGNSFEVLRALLVDGSRTNFAYTSSFGSGTLTTGTDTDFQPNTDLDGAPTVLNSITINVTNPANVRRIALFTNNGVQIGNEIAVNELKSVLNKDFVFSGSPLLIADNDSEAEIRVRVSFWNDDAHITDNNLIQVKITSTTLDAGSKFFNSPPYIAGVNGGLSAPNNVNFIEVTATSLDFVTQPSPYAGINEPITGVPGTSPGGNTGIVHARDKFAVIDVDFNFAASVTAGTTNPTLFPANFSAGILNLAGMQYQQGGVGTLLVTANGLSSDNEPWATSQKSDPVDVIHVTASLPQNPNNGVIKSPSLKGGTSNVVIFGFDIYPTYSTAAEPELNQFSITFDVPYQSSGTTILKDFKVFESLVGTYSNSANVVTLGATVTEGQSPTLVAANAPIATKDMITVTFPTPRSLKNRGQGNPITYFLVVNIDATANLATPKITPQLLDGGFGSPDNGHILTSIGSSSSDVKGTQFGFASTRPPSLVNSEPKNGALNVDPNQNTVKLYFDVGVWSHDRYILLWERYSNTLIDTLKLTGSYGFYPGAVTDPKATPAIPLTFSIPDPSKLIADSVYFITIAKGTFDPNTGRGTGISDDGFNLYGGLTYNGGLYFKIASNNPPVMLSTDPNKYYPSATGASINASFDQKEGIAYYMVVNQGGPAPTSAMIKGTAIYGGTVQTRGNFSIDQVNPNLNAGTFNVAPDLVNNRTFDVWMYAENGAPAKVPSGPYGKEANDYLENTAGPTFSVVIPKATNSVYLNKPTFQICANSDVMLTDPIIIEESTARSEFNGGSQNFNLLLPSGFTFDINTIPTIQSSGGVDFIGGGGFSHQYVNSTILRISFTNSGTSSQDKIVISNLKVRANASDLFGSIVRFAGNAFASAPSTLGDGTVFATIASGNAAALDFTNSYTTSNNFGAAPITITNPVTAIPDNYVDPDTKLGSFAVRLTPIVPKGDYGPSTFSGNGVTNDVLSLSGVPLNTAFDIIMKHVDLNGCVSEQVVQYEVYDHKQAIPALVDATYGIKDYIVNPNYLNNQPPPPFSNLADSVNRNFKAGYNLIELFANIPSRATARDTVNLANNSSTSQIMFGPAWQGLVSKIPIKKDSSDFNATLNEYYRSYYWYYGPLMPLDPALDPYKYFDDYTPEGRKFYRGGSLGQVEFTGKFRSTADATVLIPIRQEIEIYIPAIPVVEINSNAISGFDNTDPLKPDPIAWPDGTPIFCQNGTAITINGYPSATPGVSSGSFDIVDAANPLDTLYSSKITAKRYGGFVDNLNGTATLTPGALKNQNGEIANAYKDIRIVYTFKDNASPIAGSGDLVIRITPNPSANFTTSNLCEDVDIAFTDISTLSPGSGASIAQAIWSFGDNNASAKDNADTLRYPSARIPVHIYSVVGNYTVGLTTITNFGCSSTTPPSIPQFTKTLSIGGTPNVKFDFRGVSTADPIDFVSSSTVANDVIITEDWDFGDLSPVASGNTVSHTYGSSAIYNVNLTVTSQKGCFNDSTRQVVILPRVIVSDVNVYSENFETTNGGWMFYPTNATWQWTTATKTVIKNDANLNGQKVWITNNAGTYDRESYLYTASYDISALSRPMISLNSFVQMGSGDGVVIEFSTDNKNASDPTKEWFRLGTNTTGINWYNGQGLPSNPGNQIGGDYGWANTINGWQESKHSLSVDNLTTTVQKGKVVFRFALASVSARNPDGFALDNVRIGNRTRTVLIENFTNKGGNNPGEKQVSDFLKTFIGSVGTEIVKINYHVGFPGPAVDPFNAINPADPSARALFYNVVKTPTTYMDGLTEKTNPLFTQWAQSKYDSQSLNLAGAEINIAQTLSSTTGAYSVDVTVTARKQLPANTILHVGFLEQEISLASNLPTGENKFEYVLKKLLPSGAGTRFNQVLNENQTRSFTGLEWTPDTKNLYAPSNDLVLVAFLQNETTLEVYQSELIAGITDPPVVTGIWDILPEQVNVYPNPATSEFRVELPAFVQNEASIYMIDLMGRKHEAGKIAAGSSATSVNVENLSEGIYILEIGSDKTGIIRKKIMVVMNK